MHLNVLPFRIKRKYLYIGFTSLFCLVLFFIFVIPALLGPRISDSQKQWNEFRGDDPKNFPLEVVGHAYRMVRTYRTDSGKPILQWEWKVEIKNRSTRNEHVLVNYFLVDKDGLLVDVDYLISRRPAPGWETVIIGHKTEMAYEDLRRIFTGAWQVSWEGGKKKRIGY